MVFKGHIKNGVIVLDEARPLPEGASVEVSIIKPNTDLDELPTPADEAEGPTSLQSLLLDLAGKAKGLPPDLSVNLDHYLYGTPKQEP